MRHTKCRGGIATRRSPFVFSWLLIGAAVAGNAAGNASSAEQSGDRFPVVQSDEAVRARAREFYGNLPLQFEANHGQTDPRVKFLSRGSGYTLFLTATEADFVFTRSKPREASETPDVTSRSERLRTTIRTVLRATFVGADSLSRVIAEDQLPGKVNYFIGSDLTKARSNLPTYAKVHYQNLYPGIDLVYYGNQRQVEYDFVVRPHADPSRIAIRFEGADHLELDAQDDLILYVGDGAIRQRKPVIYQEEHGVRKEIQGGYALTGDHQIGFRLAAYDVSLPLVIDPILVYSTYLGGTEGGENGTGIAVDVSGNAYVTGHTGAIDFPTVNPFQPDLGGAVDVFAAKLNPSGSALVYSTYIGGSADDAGNSIAVDMSGNAYVTGSTRSADFPTVNAFQPVFGGGGVVAGPVDAFVAKLDPTGSALVYASYLGGGSGSGTSGGAEVGLGIAVDLDGNSYVTGTTGSTDFPTVDPLQAFRTGSGDAFVTKVNASGSALVYSTYLGGDSVDADVGSDIAVDSAGNAYVTGRTSSSDFPTANAFQADLAGSSDAFVTKLNPTGSALVYSTYIGGSSFEAGNGIAVNAAGHAFVTGHTGSADFPTVNPLQPVLAGEDDAFVVKLNPAGSALVYSTYIGGTASDNSNGIAVDVAGNAYITGGTVSADFPTTPNALGTTSDGIGDAFVTKLNPTGSDLAYSTYLGGGTDGDNGNDIAVDSAGNAYVVGQTASSDFTITVNAFQMTGGFPPGSASAFVTKIGEVLTFAGKAGEPDCHGESVSALARQYRGLPAAAAALGFGDVQALQEAIRRYCAD